MNGVPWELPGALQLHAGMGYLGAPPLPYTRKRVAHSGGIGKRVTGMGALEAINEHRQDAATSTTDLVGQLGAATEQGLSEQGKRGRGGGDAPETAKAQVNTLAKVLAALRW